VDDEAGWQAIAPRDPGLPGRATAQGPAFGQELVAGGAVDGAVDTTSAEKGRVGGVDDRIDVERRDVAGHDFQGRAGVDGRGDKLVHPPNHSVPRARVRYRPRG
jgi:hypothetical protein